MFLSLQDYKRNIPHTGNTWPSRTCVIKEYQFYTMSLSHYHESISLQRVFVNTMSLCLYHESMSIPRAHVNTISPCLYHEYMSIP